MMKTVILCGGQGTRIRDVSAELPKPMIPVGPYPILWHIMRYYRSFGHQDFVLATGHLGYKIKDFFLNYQSRTHDFTIDLGSRETQYHGSTKDHVDWRVTCADTGESAMTGARVKRVQAFLKDEENFFLTYGDGLSDVDLDQLLAFHQSHGKILTVTGVHPPARFGELDTDPSGLVTEFNEKPQAKAGVISGGFFVVNRRIFEYLSDAEDLVFEKGPMENLVKDQQMMLYRHEGFWQCMDTARDFQLLNSLYRSGDSPWDRREG